MVVLQEARYLEVIKETPSLAAYVGKCFYGTYSNNTSRPALIPGMWAVKIGRPGKQAH